MTEPTAAQERLKWHIGDNLRWLAEQPDRPAYMPCGTLTGMFLRLVADKLDGDHNGEGK